jgi:hypothetical protein
MTTLRLEAVSSSCRHDIHVGERDESGILCRAIRASDCCGAKDSSGKAFNHRGHRGHRGHGGKPKKGGWRVHILYCLCEPLCPLCPPWLNASPAVDDIHTGERNDTGILCRTFRASGYGAKDGSAEAFNRRGHRGHGGKPKKGGCRVHILYCLCEPLCPPWLNASPAVDDIHIGERNDKGILCRTFRESGYGAKDGSGKAFNHRGHRGHGGKTQKWWVPRSHLVLAPVNPCVLCVPCG